MTSTGEIKNKNISYTFRENYYIDETINGYLVYTLQRIKLLWHTST